MTEAERIERAARAIHDLKFDSSEAWDTHNADYQNLYRSGARAAITAYLGGDVVVPKAALDWLDGSGPDADGKWFGECEDDVVKTPRKHTPRYWWRSKFRAMISAAEMEG